MKEFINIGERKKEIWKTQGKQIAWVMRKCNVKMDGEYIWGVDRLLVCVLLVGVLPIYFPVVDVFYLLTSETLAEA